MLASFQVREARTHSCTTFYCCFCSSAESLWMIRCSECLGCFTVWLWFGMSGCRRETAARFDNLAQASLSRLGEMSRGALRPFSTMGRSGDLLSFERASVSLRRGESRLSENAQRVTILYVELSPKR